MLRQRGPPRPLPTLPLTVKLSNLVANSATNFSLKLLNAAVKSGWSGGWIFTWWFGATSALADTPSCFSCWVSVMKAGISIDAAAVMAATCLHLARPLIKKGIASRSVRRVGERRHSQNLSSAYSIPDSFGCWTLSWINRFQSAKDDRLETLVTNIADHVAQWPCGWSEHATKEAFSIKIFSNLQSVRELSESNEEFSSNSLLLDVSLEVVY